MKNPLNIELRSFVLQHSIRLEQLASEAILAMLRILKDNTKTLGNKSSSLTFKNKIDLLHDLGDIDDSSHRNLTKFMEIRNQFMHNYECKSFSAMEEINIEITKYLKSKFQNNEEDPEKSLLISYCALFKNCFGLLARIRKEYFAGVTIEAHKYASYMASNNLDEILPKAIDKWQELRNQEGYSLIATTPDLHIEYFLPFVNLVIREAESEALEKIEENFNEIFRRRNSSSETTHLE